MALEDGPVVVLFHDKLEPVIQLLGEFGARPTSTLEKEKVVSRQ